MSHAADLPLWAALPVAVLLLLGAGLGLTGSIGLLRLRSFYERVHAPTLATTLGIGCILLASMLFFSVMQTRFVLHELLITVFMVITTPVTLMLLARAALHRDRAEGNPEVPRALRPQQDGASAAPTASAPRSPSAASESSPGA
jgi:multicomponent K+:H+ antiporter subunit G